MATDMTKNPLRAATKSKMKIQRWANKYPSETSPAQDDEGWGVVLETSIGTVRLIEKDGRLEIKLSEWSTRNPPDVCQHIRRIRGSEFSKRAGRRLPAQRSGLCSIATRADTTPCKWRN